MKNRSYVILNAQEIFRIAEGLKDLSVKYGSLKKMIPDGKEIARKLRMLSKEIYDFGIYAQNVRHYRHVIKIKLKEI